MQSSALLAKSLADPSWTVLTEALRRSSAEETVGRMLDEVEHLSTSIRTSDVPLERDRILSLLSTARSVLGIVVTGQRPPPPPTDVPAPANRMSALRLRRVIEHIDHNLEKPLHLRDLAALAGVGERMLSNFFQRRFECSLGDYVRQRRVDGAKVMLDTTDISIREIAIRCGFSDQAHLTRIFHTRVGLTPRRWRIRHQSGQQV
jgi:AraC-like DNA-binding protein